MKWQNVDLELNVDSITAAIFIFSVLSSFCSLITILIYIRMKTLRTLIYRFFLHVAINELASRFALLLLFIINTVFTFRISTFVLYFTDTNILSLLGFTCFGMYQLILKQNNKFLSLFKKIVIGIYIFSFILTIVFFILSHQDSSNGKDLDLYRKVISLYLITDSDISSLASLLFTNIIYYMIIIFAFINIILILIFIRDKSEIKDDIDDNNSTNEEQNIKKSLKLRTFRIKLITYPVLGLLYYTPQLVYAWIENEYLDKKEKYQDDMMFLRIRYMFYNLYCFLNSIRGFLFFSLFIKNEKIKKFLFEKFLNFEIFETIDKIQLEAEKSANKKKAKKEKKIKNKDLSMNNDTKFDGLFEKNKKKKNKDIYDDIYEQKGSYEEQKIMDDDSDDEEININRDIKSEIITKPKKKN